MNVHEPPTHRDRETGPDPRSPDRTRQAERIERHATRVRLDGGAAQQCDGCGGDIPARTRYRHVTVREGDGGVSEYDFCDPDCVAARFD